MKKGFKIVGIIFLVIILILIGLYIIGIYADQQKNNLNSPEKEDYIWNTKTTIHKDFKAIVKEDWQEFEGSFEGYLYFIYLPKGESKENIDAEFIFVSVGYLNESNNYTLNEFLEVGIEESRKTMPDLELIEIVDKKGSYLDGKEIKFRGTSEKIKRSFIQFFGIGQSNIYTITYSCPLENCNFYDIYNAFVKSFEPIKIERES